MHNPADVVLVNPPFYRFMGSHNDKIPLSLTYLSAYLEREGVSHVVYNADYTGSGRYWSLKWMCEHYDTFVDAVDGKGSLYGEVLEHILSFDPKMVVVMGGEPLVATAEWGNPFIASHFSRQLKRMGVYTIGLGPFFTLDHARFLPDFDAIMQGEPHAGIAGIFRDRPTGLIPFGLCDLDMAPLMKKLYPADQRTDWAMTSFGCRSGCSFCLNAKLYRRVKPRVRFIDAGIVADDLKGRKEEDIYLADLDFPVASRERMEELTRAFEDARLGKAFTIDARVDAISEEKTRLLKKLNVAAVKLGIETLKQESLDSWRKGTDLEQAERAIRLLKEQGIKVIFYLLLDEKTTDEDVKMTAAFIDKWEPDFVVPNVCAYDLDSDYRYDTEFSPLRLEALGLTKELFYRFLDLQKHCNPTVGRIIQG